MATTEKETKKVAAPKETVKKEAPKAAKPAAPKKEAAPKATKEVKASPAKKETSAPRKEVKNTSVKRKGAKSAEASIKLERVSPRKARLVADLIRYKNVPEAIAILKNVNKKTAPILLKVLNSAVANAVNNNGLEADKLYVSQVIVNPGPVLKRMQPRGRGRAFSILKRTSSFMVEVTEK